MCMCGCVGLNACVKVCENVWMFVDVGECM